MSKQIIHILLYLIITVSILVFGIIYTLNYWWNSKVDFSPINTVVSFFSFGIFAILLTNFITKQFIAPKNSKYSFFVIDEDKLKNIIEIIGMQKYKNIKLINSILFICSFILTFSIFYFSTKYYEEIELKNYGTIKEIKIENKTKSLKGFDITTLHYENVEKEFYLNNFKVGENRKIIYSKNNPKIAEWYEEYQKNFR